MTRLGSFGRRFGKDSEGSILSFWAVAMAAIFGLLALSYDFGRLASTQSDLQTFADNVALAAAGELDGKSDSITRATNAAAAFITDRQSFGEGGATLSGADDYTLTFYKERPNEAGTVPSTTDAANAGFVRVDVDDQTVSPIFGAAFAALTSQTSDAATTSATAVAGYTSYACDITPMMFCAPSIDFRADDSVGMSVQLRAGGNNGAWGPGAFGWIDVVGNSATVDIDGVCSGLVGNMLDLCMIAAKGNRSSCFATSGIEVANGQRIGNFEAAVNTLFDIYAASAIQLRNDPLYAPSGNVRSSYMPALGSCIGSGLAVPSLTSMGLPPDDCHASGSCGRYGSADWSQGRAEYVLRNYGLTDPFPDAETRYDYYKAELEAMAQLTVNGNGDTSGNGNSDPGNAGNPANDGGSTSSPDLSLTSALGLGLPQCSKNADFDPQRRTMIAAVVDCTDGLISAGAADVKVQEFAEIFLLSPVGLDGTLDVWVEIVRGIDRPADGTSSGAVLRDVVVLYD